MRRLLLGWIVVGAISSHSIAQNGAKQSPDITPCSEDHPPKVSAEEAFNHARRVRLTGKTQNDGERLVCWLEAAANQGHAKAQTQLAFMYYDAESVPDHTYIAAKLMEKAAKQGNLIAEVRLSQFYSNGEGVPRVTLTAKYWMDTALAQAEQAGQLQGKTKQEQTDFLLTLATTAGVSAGLPTDRDAEYLRDTDAPTKEILCSEGFDKYCAAAR
jgi:TPR repeat protein